MKNQWEGGSSGRVAAIDLGTNTFLLLIAEMDRGKVRPLLEKETVVRLGKGLQKEGLISENSMRRGWQTLSEYLVLCKEWRVQRVFAVGTSALREAKNATDFLQRIQEKLDLTVEVISGEEEACLSYTAVARDLDNSETSIMVIDVGGGSTELIRGRGDRILERVSLPMGLVHFTERFLTSNPVRPEEYHAMEREIQVQLDRIPQSPDPVTLVSVGGTGTTLASVAQGLSEFDAERIHHFVLKGDALRRQLTLFLSKTIEQRKAIPGLPPARADVILAGAAILCRTMERLRCPSVLISSHGVRYGLLYQKLTAPVHGARGL